MFLLVSVVVCVGVRCCTEQFFMISNSLALPDSMGLHIGWMVCLSVCLFGLLLPSNSLRYREYGYVLRYSDSSWICVKVSSLVVAGSKARFVLFYSNPILAQKHATFVPLLFDVAVSMHAVAFMWGIWTDAVEYGIHRHIGVGTGADAVSRVPGAVDIIAV